MSLDEPDDLFYRRYLGGATLIAYYLLKAFWQLVAQYCPDWQGRKQWLKDHEIELATLHACSMKAPLGVPWELGWSRAVLWPASVGVRAAKSVYIIDVRVRALGQGGGDSSDVPKRGTRQS